MLVTDKGNSDFSIRMYEYAFESIVFANKKGMLEFCIACLSRLCL